MTKKTLLKAGSVPVILAVGFVAMQALGSTDRESKKRNRTAEPRAVETERLSFGDLELRIEGDGLIESERRLDVVSEATGRVTFARNDLKDGTFVRNGEVVVRIDARDIENELHVLRSEFMNAVAAVLPELQLDDAKVWRKWFDYFNTLDIDRPVPELPEITRPQEKIKISTRDVIGKYYQVKNQEILLSKHTVRAPFDGYVTSAGVIGDAFVSQGQRLFTLTDARNLVIAVPLLVEETELLDFATSPEARIYPGGRGERAKRGRIVRRQTNVDPNSQTLDIYVGFRNDDLDPHFLPGNYVHVEIAGRTLHDVATVPRHLIGAEDHVYTFRADGTLGREKVEVVAHQGDRAVIGNTIPDETIVVTTILQQPLVGMAVRSTNMPELAPDTELARTHGDTSATEEN